MSIDLTMQSGPDLCISDAAQQHARWLEALVQIEAGQPCQVTLDLSPVVAIDSAGLQLLIALKAQAEASGGALLLKDVPPVVSGALLIFGLDDQLQAREAMP